MKIMHLINLKTIVPGENHAVRRRAPLQQVWHRPPQHQRWVIKKMPKIDTLDALEEHEEHDDDYQTITNWNANW